MTRCWLAVLVAVLALGLATGCATTDTPAAAATPYQVGQGALGLRAEDDPAYSMGHPFRLFALVVYPWMLAAQRAFEFPYVVATQIEPTLFGVSEIEQQYLRERWGVRPGVFRESPDREPTPK